MTTPEVIRQGEAGHEFFVIWQGEVLPPAPRCQCAGRACAVRPAFPSAERQGSGAPPHQGFQSASGGTQRQAAAACGPLIDSLVGIVRGGGKSSSGSWLDSEAPVPRASPVRCPSPLRGVHRSRCEASVYTQDKMGGMCKAAPLES